MPVLPNIIPEVDSILGIRDQIGAVLKPVYLVTRTWSGNEPGDGTAVDTRAQILPSPSIKEFTIQSRIREGGAVEAGDILVKMISKQSYPTKAQVDCSGDDPKVQKFYQVGTELYVVRSVEEKHVTWTVQIRKHSDQRTYFEEP